MTHKPDVEKIGKNFESHIKHDHNFWKYCNYLCYIVDKGRDELTGFEFQVWQEYSNRSTLWIPQVESEEAETLEALKLHVDGKFAEMFEKIDKLSEKVKAAPS